MVEEFQHSREHLDDQMIKMEVNLDDEPGEWLGYVMEKCLDSGANDVFCTPIYMKKNRPGVLLQLLCHKSKIDEMKHILFTETTTLGIRYYPITVHRLGRQTKQVDLEWGKVTVKEGIYQGEVIQRSPEYEDCRRIAHQFAVPLKEVYQQVWERLGQRDRFVVPNHYKK